MQHGRHRHKRPLCSRPALLGGGRFGAPPFASGFRLVLHQLRFNGVPQSLPGDAFRLYSAAGQRQVANSACAAKMVLPEARCEATAAEVQRFQTAVRAHEKGHVQACLSLAAFVQALVKEMPQTVPVCMVDSYNRAFYALNAMVERMARTADAAYDVLTRHGAKLGAEIDAEDGASCSDNSHGGESDEEGHGDTGYDEDGDDSGDYSGDYSGDGEDAGEDGDDYGDYGDGEGDYGDDDDLQRR